MDLGLCKSKIKKSDLINKKTSFSSAVAHRIMIGLKFKKLLSTIELMEPFLAEFFEFPMALTQSITTPLDISQKSAAF